MRKFLYLILLTLVLVSCGTDGQHFKIDGRLLHLNQGEFYVYSPDGTLKDMDTIKVEAGRFTSEIPCTRPMTLMIVFPNFTEQPVFAQPGKTVEIRGSASNLKEMKVTGTKDNELMNDFREQIESASPPEMKQYARQFIIDHPQSVVGSYLVRKYFIQTLAPDYATADRLIATMLEHQKDNGYLRLIRQRIKGLDASLKGMKIPQFTATDINGNVVSDKSLAKETTVVVCAWASWNFESINYLRQLMALQNDDEYNFQILGVCVDMDKQSCRRIMTNNDIDCKVVCDGDGVDGKLYRTLGLCYIPDNVIIRNGRIAERNLEMQDLKDILKKK